MLKVLLVEKDPLIVRVYKQKFAAAEIETEIASSKEEALSKIREGFFDLIMIEPDLGDESGLDILREIRSDAAYSPNLPVLVFKDGLSRATVQEIIPLHVASMASKIDYTVDRLVLEIYQTVHMLEEQRKNEERIRNGGYVKPKGKTILLVEDDLDLREIYSLKLRNEGYVVDTAVDGVEGYEMAQTGKYDLLISDIDMPRMNGEQLVAKLKETESTKDLPVFIFSASVTADHLNKMRCEGLICFLKIHLTPGELMREVNRFFEARSKGESLG